MYLSYIIIIYDFHIYCNPFLKEKILNVRTFSYRHTPNNVGPSLPQPYKTTQQPQSPNRVLQRGTNHYPPTPPLVRPGIAPRTILLLLVPSTRPTFQNQVPSPTTRPKNVKPGRFIGTAEYKTKHSYSIHQPEAHQEHHRDQSLGRGSRASEAQLEKRSARDLAFSGLPVRS